jgi:glycosyltransferase involved in cell wall biosynthesis
MLVHSVYSRDPRVRRYAEHLAKLGHEVDVIGLAADVSEQSPPYSTIKIYPIALKRERKGGAWQAVEWLISGALMFFKLTRLWISRRHDFIHVNNMPDFLVFSAWIPRLFRKVVILDVHDPIPELMRSKMGLDDSHWLVRTQKFLERISVSFSSHVLTATPSFARILIQRGAAKGKVTVVMNAADPEIFRPSLDTKKSSTPNERFTLLYVGTVARRYGLEIAVKALPLIREHIPNLLLRIVTRMGNEGEEVKYLTGLAEDLGVSDILSVEPPVPLEEVPELMKSADIGLYPAIRDCHMDIALSLKAPEMLLVGLPMVSSRLSALEEIFGEDAIVYFPSGDWRAMARKVVELYNDPQERFERAKKGVELASNLSWPEQFRAYLEALARLRPEMAERLFAKPDPASLKAPVQEERDQS